eukprot:CAMPEP_0172312486 /NCGR_PEP_ID=MMETSP1058-20130122/17671_1 /TAXON_ID=83371 /ORGANISM="Detonula confervacea, Strain CCMP 353" /LENGTH=783 /DNA_ID=CAMNT_0013025965 /DNA_START=76 /DNA_END=2427 /DNA_ORIENTATION=+
MKSSSRNRAAAAGFTFITCCQHGSGALTTPTTLSFISTSNRRSSRPSLFARKQQKPKPANRPSTSRRSSTIIEEVQPLTSVSKEKRLSALEALTQDQRGSGKRYDSPLLADMDAAAMLLETFTQATNDDASSVENDDNKIQYGVAQKRMGSVAGATSMSMLRQQAAKEGGYSMSPRDSKHLYREDGSNQARWAVGSLIEKLDEKIKEQSDDPSDTPAPKKRGRGRPRKNPLPEAEAVASLDKVVKVNPIQPLTNKSSATVTGGSLMTKDTEKSTPSKNKKVKKPSKVTVVKGSTKKYAEPLIGARAIVNKQRRRVVKSLPKSRRDENGNIIPSKGVYNNPGRGVSPDSLNLNRYYKTELLKAKEEYSLGMKVKFMVKCDAVHEGLSLQLDRNPTIAEWAAACGFDTHDAEMCSENYVDNDLDRQIRPSGSEVDELDPNMFVGNGLVNDSGVGRGKGRAKKPPPTVLADFIDDSYEKFKGKEKYYEEDEEEVDIFLYRQKKAPGEPINRGSPRIFREMILTAKEAKQRMVQCNMRLVVSIARRYHGVGVNVQDLVQEGSLGLARAAEKFDPKKGFKFSTYASWWIQQAVFRSIAYHSRTIRLPVHVHNLLNKVRRARSIREQELGRLPTNEEMADEMEMSIEKYNKMIRNTRNAISLEQAKYKNNPKDLGHESEALVGDMVDSSAVIFDEKTPEQTVDHGLLHNDIQYMLGKLGHDERTVLCLRYGINDGITRTVTLVASEMRQTKSWVRSQECRALRKLRRPWYEKRLTEHRESLQASHSLPL